MLFLAGDVLDFFGEAEFLTGDLVGEFLVGLYLLIMICSDLDAASRLLITKLLALVL